jgi:hypothetical protein
LGFRFPLHQKKLDAAKNKDMVAQIIHDLCGQTIEVKTEIIKKNEPVEVSSPLPEEISTISSIFGNAEVVEA